MSYASEAVIVWLD
ncbi:unnamed protein product, partial [Adineta steineri]